jgi:hypothetical protein
MGVFRKMFKFLSELSPVPLWQVFSSVVKAGAKFWKRSRILNKAKKNGTTTGLSAGELRRTHWKFPFACTVTIACPAPHGSI